MNTKHKLQHINFLHTEKKRDDMFCLNNLDKFKHMGDRRNLTEIALLCIKKYIMLAMKMLPCALKRGTIKLR